jgi:site-specific recombinase XerC
MVDQEIPRETDEPTSWIDRYGASRLAFKRETTRNTYTIILRQFLTWLSNLPGHELSFNPALDLTQTAVQTYLFGELTDMSVSHRERVKSILSSFAEWLIDEAFITRNPTRGIEFPAQQLLAPRELETSQRYLLKELIESEDLRGKAMFALGYYAGCRASDVCWFRLDQVHHLTKKSGHITVGYKRGQLRTIDLMNEAGKPCEPIWKRSANRSRRTALLSSSHSESMLPRGGREITPGDSPREGCMPGGAPSRSGQPDSSGSRSPISPFMTCGMTSAIGCVLPALPWRR